MENVSLYVLYYFTLGCFWCVTEDLWRSISSVGRRKP